MADRISSPVIFSASSRPARIVASRINREPIWRRCGGMTLVGDVPVDAAVCQSDSECPLDQNFGIAIGRVHYDLHLFT
jgi:hypothetical protein